MQTSNQTTAKPTCRETCGERLPNAAIASPNIKSIPGFSSEQVNEINGFMIQMTNMMDIKLEAHFRRIEANQSALMTAIHQLSQQMDPTSTDKPSLPAQSIISPLVQATITTVRQEKHVTVQIQEMESYVQEMEHSAPSNEMKPGKHVVLQRTMVSWVHRCWHAAIQSNWMSGMIMVGYGPNRMRRLGIG